MKIQHLGFRQVIYGPCVQITELLLLLLTLYPSTLNWKVSFNHFWAIK